MTTTSFSGLVRQRTHSFLQDDVVRRIWNRDPSVWVASGRGPDTRAAMARSIATRLGWLDAPAAMRPYLGTLADFAGDAHALGIDVVYLLGMGGSSLCAEVLRTACSSQSDRVSLTVLDTTDEATIVRTCANLVAHRSLFLVSSKSGTTVEVNSLERLFNARMTEALGSAACGLHFVAITDPGTPLERLAAARGYRRTFLNPPDIGGRFSALSLFGLVPGVLIGADIGGLLDGAVAMADECRRDSKTNPGLALGVFMGEGALSGRDKLTVFLPSRLGTFGLWIEQLVAESTGKEQKGLLPIVDESLGSADRYGGDRLFVAVDVEDEHWDTGALEQDGHPVFHLSARTSDLGGEFFRWEFATAVAGAVLGINPFDEPNVQEAKERTRELLAQYTKSGRITDAGPTASPAMLRAAIDALGPADYVACLSYLAPEPNVVAALNDARSLIRERAHVATTLGIGPRYLHSTGQYHKGGPATALCVLITADDATETGVPESPYSFAVLKRAQALGDFKALQAHGRRTLRIHLEAKGKDQASELREFFRAAL